MYATLLAHLLSFASLFVVIDSTFTIDWLRTRLIPLLIIAFTFVSSQQVSMLSVFFGYPIPFLGSAKSVAEATFRKAFWCLTSGRFFIFIARMAKPSQLDQESEGVGLHLLHKRIPNLAFPTSPPQPCDIHRYTLKELVGIVQQEVGSKTKRKLWFFLTTRWPIWRIAWQGGNEGLAGQKNEPKKTKN